MTHSPCEKAKSIRPYLEDQTSNYLEYCILNGRMPVITLRE